MKKIIALFIGIIVFNSGRAQSEADSLEKVLPKLADSAKARVMAELAELCEYTDQEKAISYGEQAVVLGGKTGRDGVVADAYNALGLICTGRSEYDKAEGYFNKAVVIYEKRNDKFSLSEVYSNLGVVYDYRGDYVKTLELYNKSFKLSEEIKDTLGTAYALYNIGNIYNLQGNLGKAMNNWVTAGKIFDKMNKKEGTSSVYLNIGLMYKRQGNIKKGLEYYEMALKIAEEIQELSLLSDIYNNIGVLYLEDKKDNEKALFYMNKCLDMAIKQHDDYSEASAELNIGQIRQNQERYSEANEHYSKAIKIFRQIGDNTSLAVALNHLGNSYNSTHDYTKAIAYSEEALAKAKGQGLKEEIHEIYHVLSDAYFKSGNLAKAYEYQTLLSEIKDSIYKAKNGKQMMELQSKYDSDKKEKEIEILQQQNEIQQLDLKKKRIVIYSVIGALLLLVVLSLLVYNRYQIKRKANVQLAAQNEEIQNQKNIIEEKNKDITDSIIYAKRIQDTMLPSLEVLKQRLPEIFVLFRPKDIVSGDFYFSELLPDGSVVVAAVDCTGHGVPGAFMSIVGNNSLYQSIHEHGKIIPSEILDQLNRLVNKTLHQNTTTDVKDGMDISLCSIHLDKMTLQYAGAMNSLYHIRNSVFREIKADKLYIGTQAEQKAFSNHELALEKGDTIYLYTDGFADQFGGPKGKKFKYKPLQELLVSLQSKSMKEQQEILNTTVEEWKGNLEQVDDILIIGIRV